MELMLCSSFFLQAEDGIRDLVRSRGLGDVYKRQAEGRRVHWRKLKGIALVEYANGEIWEVELHWFESVSYTHLTLPTSDLV